WRVSTTATAWASTNCAQATASAGGRSAHDRETWLGTQEGQATAPRAGATERPRPGTRDFRCRRAARPTGFACRPPPVKGDEDHHAACPVRLGRGAARPSHCVVSVGGGRGSRACYSYPNDHFAHPCSVDLLFRLDHFRQNLR